MRGPVPVLQARLDPHARACLRRIGGGYSRLYGWLTAVEGRAAERRRQAVTLYPVPIYVALPLHSAFVELGTIVDQGRPLVPALAQCLEVPRAAIRRLRGVTVRRAIVGQDQQTGFPFDHLAMLAPQWLPVTRRDFRALTRLTRIAREIAPAGGAGLVHQLLRGFRPPLGVIAELEDTASTQIVDALRDLDTVAFFHRFDDPDWCPEHWEGTDEILGPRNLASLHALAIRWHRTAVDRSVFAETTSLDCPASWSGCLSEPVAVAGLRIVELTTPQELAAEGSVLTHCVAQYANRCFAGRSRILSIRDRSDRSVATAELVMHGQAIDCAQLRGHANTNPGAAAEAALNQLMERIRRGEIPIELGWPKLSVADQSGLDLSDFWVSELAPLRVMAP